MNNRKTNDYRIQKEYIEPIQYILERDNIPYQFKKIENEYIVSVGISWEEFEIVLEDAECEIQRNRTMSKAPVYSLRTLGNKEKLHRLFKLNQRKDFTILEKDREEFLRYQ